MNLAAMQARRTCDCRRSSALRPAVLPADGAKAHASGAGFEHDFSAVPATATGAAASPKKAATCDQPLTWADFPGPAPTPPAGAVTKYQLSLDASVPVITVTLLKSSGVNDRARKPTHRTANGCGTSVADCEKWLATNPGGWYSLGESTGCDAAFSPDTSLQATKVPECDTVLGAECDRVAQLNSDRLLKHEQYHWSIACVMTEKGNAAIAAGMKSAEAFAATAAKAGSLTAKYDTDSKHGCNESGQLKWEGAVDAGLPAEKIAPAAKKTQPKTTAPKAPPPKTTPNPPKKK